MANAGYSGTPLVKKLGIKDHFTIKFVNQPDHYFELIEKLPEELDIQEANDVKKDFIHLFTQTKSDLESKLVELKPNFSRTA